MRTRVVTNQVASSRPLQLATSLVLAVAILVAPTMFFGRDGQPPLVVAAEFVAAGILLGLGRQGIDVIVLRLLTTSLALLLGWAAVAAVQARKMLCPDIAGCQELALGLIFGAILIALLLAVVAIPTNLALTHSLSALKPELPWQRLPLPQRWWQWLAAFIVSVVVLYFIAGLLGLHFD